MILDIFILLICMAIAFIIIGVYIRIELFSIIGFLFIAMLGGLVLLSGYSSNPNLLQYQNGYNITTAGNTTVVTPVYASYNDSTSFWVGYLLAIVGILSPMLLYWVYRVGG